MSTSQSVTGKYHGTQEDVNQYSLCYPQVVHCMTLYEIDTKYMENSEEYICSSDLTTGVSDTLTELSTSGTEKKISASPHDVITEHSGQYQHCSSTD